MTDRNHIPTLTTPRLKLRPFSPEDTVSLHRIMNEPDIMQYFPRTDPPDMERVQRIIEHQFTHWETYNLGWWAVVPNGGSKLIGWNGLQYLPETGEVEVGYLLSQQFWGQGLATEGARASLEFGFKTLGLQQIIGLTHPENIASQNVLKKCGLKYIEQKEYFGMQLFCFSLSIPARA
jgi:ribosomal-protein-alanine N-acetyltransferase